MEGSAARPGGQARPYLVGAKADTIRLTASTQLLAIGAQRRGLGEADGPAAARRAPAEVVVDPLPGNPPGQTFPGGEIYLSFPGLGDRLAAQGGPRALGNRLARGALTLPDPPSGVTTKELPNQRKHREPQPGRPPTCGRA